MSEGANDALSAWIRAGMPESRNPYTDRCGCCGKVERTVTGNWTWCDEVQGWHGSAFGKKELPSKAKQAQEA